MSFLNPTAATGYNLLTQALILMEYGRKRLLLWGGATTQCIIICPRTCDANRLPCGQQSYWRETQLFDRKSLRSLDIPPHASSTSYFFHSSDRSPRLVRPLSVPSDSKDIAFVSRSHGTHVFLQYITTTVSYSQSALVKSCFCSLLQGHSSVARMRPSHVLPHTRHIFRRALLRSWIVRFPQVTFLRVDIPRSEGKN